MSPQFVVCALLGLKMRLPQFSLLLTYILVYEAFRRISTNLGMVLCTCRIAPCCAISEPFVRQSHSPNFISAINGLDVTRLRWDLNRWITEQMARMLHNTVLCTAQHYPHFGSWTLGWEDYVESPLGSFWSLNHLIAAMCERGWWFFSSLGIDEL